MVGEVCEIPIIMAVDLSTAREVLLTTLYQIINWLLTKIRNKRAHPFYQQMIWIILEGTYLLQLVFCRFLDLTHFSISSFMNSTLFFFWLSENFQKRAQLCAKQFIYSITLLCDVTVQKTRALCGPIKNYFEWTVNQKQRIRSAH